MILGFAQFKERPRKLQKIIKKTASKRQWNKYEKSLKNGAKMEPTTIKNPFKNRCVFQDPPKTMFFAPRTAPGHLKVAVFIFLARSWRPLGF